MIYALFMGSAKRIPDVSIPINSRIVKKQLREISSAFENFIGTSDYKFAWANGEDAQIMLTPSKGKLSDKIDEIETVTDKDIFLFYYFGHGYVHDNKLVLAYRNFKLTDEESTLDFLFEKIARKGFKKIAFILDCCYAGKGFDHLFNEKSKFYAIGGAYNKFTYLSENSEGGVFSNQFIKALENINSKILLSNKKTKITLKDIFNLIKENINLNKNTFKKQPDPYEYGDIGDIIIVKDIKNDIYNFESFDFKIKINSLYYKLHFIMNNIIGSNKKSLEEIYTEIKDNEYHPFLIDERTKQFVGIKMVEDYLKILIKLEFLKMNNNKYEISNPIGLNAIHNESKLYNKYLINRLYHWMLMKNDLQWSDIASLRMKTIDTLTSLIKDFQVPSFINFKDRFESLHNTKIISNREDLKIILKLLSYSKEIRRLDSHSYFTN